MLETGIKAPDFELPDQNGNKINGKVTMGVVRTTYLIDENGLIVRALGKVNASENPVQMLSLL